MKITAAIVSIVLYTIGISTVNAEPGCYYNTNSKPLKRADCDYHAQRACEGYDGKQGAFQPGFNPGEKRSICVDVFNDRVNMEIRNENTNAWLDLNDQDCIKEFRAILQRCSYTPIDTEWTVGGTNANSGWWFNIDPNAGRC